MTTLLEQIKSKGPEKFKRKKYNLLRDHNVEYKEIIAHYNAIRCDHNKCQALVNINEIHFNSNDKSNGSLKKFEIVINVTCESSRCSHPEGMTRDITLKMHDAEKMRLVPVKRQRK